MTSEITTLLPPADVLAAAKRFFTGPEPYHEAWLETESEGHVSFGTFRGNIAVAAFPDPREEAPTRVRVSTLRDEGAVPRLLTYLGTLQAPEPEPEASRPEAAAEPEAVADGA